MKCVWETKKNRLVHFYAAALTPSLLSPSPSAPPPVMEERRSLIPTNLSELLDNTVKVLNDIWNQIGLSPQERQDQLAHLLKQTNDLYRTKISTEQALVQAYQVEVSKLRRDILQTREVLGLQPQPKSSTQPLTLVKELTNLRVDFEQLDSKRRKLETLLQDKEKRVQEMSQELGLPFSTRTSTASLTIEREVELDDILPTRKASSFTTSGGQGSSHSRLVGSVGNHLVNQ
jgi:hypothetical protein